MLRRRTTDSWASCGPGDGGATGTEMEMDSEGLASDMFRTLSDMIEADPVPFLEEEFADLLAAAPGENGFVEEEGGNGESTSTGIPWYDLALLNSDTEEGEAEAQSSTGSSRSAVMKKKQKAGAPAVVGEPPAATRAIVSSSSGNKNTNGPTAPIGALATTHEEELTTGDMQEMLESKQLFTDECEMLLLMYDADQCEVVRDRPDPTTAEGAEGECGEEGSGDGFIKSLRIQILPQHVLDMALKVRHRQSDGLVLNIFWRKGYPSTRGPEVSIEPWHNLLTRDEVDGLYRALAKHCQEMQGSPMLSDICGFALHKTDDCVSKPEELAFCPQEIQEKIREATGRGRAAGVAADSPDFCPSQYIGPVTDLLGRLPRGYDVVNVENILKEDLAIRFDKMQRYMYKKHVEKYEKQRGARLLQHVVKMADITPAFHGTRMENVGKIVRNGLLVPGKETGHKVRVGSRYGNGIYSSPDPDLALWYAEHGGHQNAASVKIMIVAVLLGKSKVILDGEEPWGGGCSPGFDSHVSEDGSQFCIFHEWQILPCYVVHLMERTYNWESRADVGGITGKADASKLIPQNASRRTRQQILTAIARKNLPFGFGPAGRNFVVEEIGSYSDDEEDWGEYQGELRGGLDEFHEEYQHETMLNAVTVNRGLPSYAPGSIQRKKFP